MNYLKIDAPSENEVRCRYMLIHHRFLTMRAPQGYSKPSGLKLPSQLPKMASSHSRALGELQDSSINVRSAIPPPPSTMKHKPSGCKLPT
jgi:hypothetical protein